MNNSHLDEQFLRHYQFSHDPFAARVPNFKFFSAQRKTILGQMHHLARHSQLMLIITGPQNSGKTLLRQALIASLNKDMVHIVNISAKDCSTPAQVIAVLSDELKLTENTPEAIITHLTKLSEKEISLYLMVDEAEDLPEDVLQLLLNLTSEQLKNLHIFLFARPSLLEKLEESTLGKEVTFNLPLTPYTLEETKEYLSMRLEGVDQSLALFSDEQLLSIYTRSGGWPGVINQEAKESLLLEFEAQQQELPVSTRFEQAVDPVLRFEDDQKDDEPPIGSLFSEREQKAPPPFFASTNEKVPKKAKSTGFIPKKHLAIAGVVAIVLVGIIFFSRSSTAPINDKDTDVVGDHYNSISNADTQTINLPLTQGAETIPVDGGDANASQGVPLPPNDTMPTTDVPVITANSTLPTPVVTEAPTVTQTSNLTTPNTVPEQTTASTTKPSVDVKPITTPVTKPEQTKPKSTSKTVGLDNAWYRNQTGTDYTIQVSVASTVKSAQDFIKKQTGDYRYYKRSRSGKVDYVITYGHFSGRNLAQNAIKKLPQDIQRGKPWVRTFASIKSELAN